MIDNIRLVGLNHRSATVGIRERHAVSPSALPSVLLTLSLTPGIDEVAIVSTCNRVEAYLVGTEAAAHAVERSLFPAAPHDDDCLYRLSCPDTVIHLFRVAAGLDSMIPGEPHILSQVESALEQARTAGTAGDTLTALFTAATGSGRDIRASVSFGTAETASVPAAALELARREHGDLRGTHALLLGTGKMTVLAARLAREAGVARLTVAGRNPGHARATAATVDAGWTGIDGAIALLGHVDMVVCATAAPDYLASAALLAPALAARPAGLPDLILIDISVPRNIDPRAGDLRGVRLFNIDDLHRILEDAGALPPATRHHAEQLTRNDASAFVDSHRQAACA